MPPKAKKKKNLKPCAVAQAQQIITGQGLRWRQDGGMITISKEGNQESLFIAPNLTQNGRRFFSHEDLIQIKNTFKLKRKIFNVQRLPPYNQ